MTRGVLAFALCCICLLHGSNANAQKSDSLKYSNWNVRISPYFWFVNLKGTIYRPPVPSNYPQPVAPFYDIDISFRELSSSIKFAMMANGEYRQNRFSMIFNYTSLILDGAAVTPLDLVLQNLRLHLDYHAGDVSFGYRFILKPKIELDGYLGMKFVYFGVNGSTELIGAVPWQGARSKFWWEPIISTRVIYRPVNRLDIHVYADAGGFLTDPETSFQVIGGATFSATKWLTLTAGYRYWAMRAKKDEAIYNGSIRGWVTRVGFQF